MLSTGKLPLRGLPRNSLVRITDCPDIISAVYHGLEARNQTDKIADKQMFLTFLINRL